MVDMNGLRFTARPRGLVRLSHKATPVAGLLPWAVARWEAGISSVVPSFSLALPAKTVRFAPALLSYYEVAC